MAGQASGKPLRVLAMLKASLADAKLIDTASQHLAGAQADSSTCQGEPD